MRHPATRKLVLASASPRRRQLLTQIGCHFEIAESNYREVVPRHMPPKQVAMHLSRGKALAVAVRYPNALIIAADTIVVSNGKILGKPRNAAHAEKMLTTLSGRRHSVITGLTVIDTANKKTIIRAVTTDVYMNKSNPDDIRQYVRSKEPLDKAGAYAIQGWGALFIEKIYGDYYNVMGLPLVTLASMLKKFDIEVRPQK
ncbi:MAG: Maf family protein [Patescibacteria group bacterium]